MTMYGRPAPSSCWATRLRMSSNIEDPGQSEIDLDSIQRVFEWQRTQPSGVLIERFRNAQIALMVGTALAHLVLLEGLHKVSSLQHARLPMASGRSFTIAWAGLGAICLGWRGQRGAGYGSRFSGPAFTPTTFGRPPSS